MENFFSIEPNEMGFDSEVLINNEYEKSISGLLMRNNKRSNGKLPNMYENKKKNYGSQSFAINSL